MDKIFKPDTTFLTNGKTPEDTCALSDLPKEGVIGLYFSAHWCPPCRGFTPKLAESYKAIRAAGKAFQVVFLSSDKDDKAFLEYFAEQPWLALPFAERDLKAKLSKKYKVSGIPSLVLLDAATGNVITKDGRSALSSDTEGKKFPWTPPTLAQALGDVLRKPDGTEVKREEALKDKYVGLYFSAHWCPPCKGFTPKLAETYKKIVAKRSDFEIVFVSSDKDETAFKEYFGEMPWLAMPFDNKDGKEGLDTLFEVEGIPTLVLIGPDGKTITTEARAPVEADPEGAEFPWLPKPVEDVESKGAQLNETTAIVAFCEGANAEEVARIKAALTTEAEEVFKAAAAAEEDADLIFCTCSDKEGRIGAQVRKLCGLGEVEEGKVQLAILDIPDNGGYYVYEGGEVSAATIKAFISDYKNSKLERKQLG